MNNLAQSIPMLSQGVPFFHAGDDILRSKSLDRNSYDSGDWYNAIDWSYATNNWGIGLPIEGSSYYEIFKPLLANPALKPQSTDLEFAHKIFNEFLQIRKSSGLFRLQTAEQIMGMLTFLNNGPEAMPGLIVMRLMDTEKIDPKYSEVLVLVNANHQDIQFSDPSLASQVYTLHPVQQNSSDATVKQAKFDSASGTFSVPATTTAVFVVEQKGLELSRPVGIAMGALVILMIAGVVFLLVGKLLPKKKRY
jgi:pullulanase